MLYADVSGATGGYNFLFVLLGLQCFQRGTVHAVLEKTYTATTKEKLQTDVCLCLSGAEAKVLQGNGLCINLVHIRWVSWRVFQGFHLCS